MSEGIPLQAQSTSIVASGTWGTCPWELDADGKLTVHPGKGANTEYDSNGSSYCPWAGYADDIRSIAFAAKGGAKAIAPARCTGLFHRLDKLASLDLSGLDTSKVTDMASMFSGCKSLASLDLSPLDTSNVTNVGYMFYGCSSLKTLDLSPLDTSKVTRVEGMFYGCSKLASLGISSFDTSKVTSMGGMFSGCKSLASLDLSPLDTSSVTSMSGMFEDCSSLASLDLSPLDMSKVAYTYGMFAGCSSLTSLDLSPFGASKLQYTYGMFAGCSSLTSLDISPLDTSKVTRMDSMFAGCKSLASLDLSSFDTSSATNMSGLFCGSSSLVSLDLSGLETPNAWDMSDMFYGCSSLAYLDLSGLDTSKVGWMNRMFSGCSSLKSLDLSPLDTSKVTHMGQMFYDCVSLASLDLSGFSTSAAADMRDMFSGCSGLRSLDLSGFNMGNVTNKDGMFYACISLASVKVGEGFSGILPSYEVAGRTDWRSTKAGAWFTADQIASGRKGIVDTYTKPTAKSIAAASVTAPAQVYSGKALRPAPTVKLGGKTLVNGSDYVASYANNVNAGTATVIVTGCGGYAGTVSARFAIAPAGLAAAQVSGVTARTYTGAGQWQEPKVVMGGRTLAKGTDYAIKHENNVNAGTATVTVTGQGNYSGSKESTFRIARADLSDAQVTGITNRKYSGEPQWQDPKVVVGGRTLAKGADYTLSHASNKEPGTATVTIKGTGNYTGSKSVNFKISRNAISIATATISGVTNRTYTEAAQWQTPVVKLAGRTLVQGIDYTVRHAGNVNAGTATVTVTGIGGYSGSKAVTFTIAKASMSSAAITGVTNRIYTGAAQWRNPTVKLGGRTLVKDTDYTLKHANNVKPGIAKVTVSGKGNYAGSKSVEFKIEAAKGTFAWGRDNWNYLNSTYYGDFKQSRYVDQINGAYLAKLKANLTPSEYAAVFTGSWWNPGWIYEEWGGSCYGMSSTALLAKAGLLPYSRYRNGATQLNQLVRPTESIEVSSLVTYYQMLQVKDVIQRQYRTVKARSHKDNIEQIISLLDRNSTVLLGFRKDGWGGHAILAYDYEYGSWTWSGVTYGGRIKICDPNSSTVNDENYYIYFDRSSYEWAIPAYSYAGVRSTSGAVFNYVGASTKEINEGGYLSGTGKANAADAGARLDAPEISGEHLVAKAAAAATAPGVYVHQNTAPGDIEADYSYVLTGESKGVPGYNLRDGAAAYKVSQANPAGLRLVMSYPASRMTATSGAATSALFDCAGHVEVNGDAAAWSLSMTLDSDHPTDWFTVSASGSGARHASIDSTGEGYVISGDSLKGVSVTVGNKDVTATTTTFTTALPSALVYEIDERTVGVKVDADGNGSYETVITDGSTAGAHGGATVDRALQLIGLLPATAVLKASDADAVKAARAAWDSLDAAGKDLAGSAALARLQAAEKRMAKFGTSWDVAKAQVTGVNGKSYTGSKVWQSGIEVTAGGKTLKRGSDYTVVHSNNLNAGEGRVTISGIGSYVGQQTVTFKIAKAANKLTVSRVTDKYQASASAATVVFGSKIFKISNPSKGAISYAKKSGPAKVTIDAKTGKVTVAKGLKPGTYWATFTVKSAATANYNAASKNVSIAFVVK